MNKFWIPILAFLIVTANIVFGYFQPSFAILLTPLVLPLVTVLLVFAWGKNSPITLASMVYGLIALNDVGIKLFADGMHNHEGLAWIHASFYIGLLISFVLFVAGNAQLQHISRRKKVIGALLLPALVAVHLIAFNNLGLEYSTIVSTPLVLPF